MRTAFLLSIFSIPLYSFYTIFKQCTMILHNSHTKTSIPLCLTPPQLIFILSPYTSSYIRTILFQCLVIICSSTAIEHTDSFGIQYMLLCNVIFFYTCTTRSLQQEPESLKGHVDHVIYFFVFAALKTL